MENNKTELSILFFSDVHRRNRWTSMFKTIDKLLETEKFDYIFNTGDLVFHDWNLSETSEFNLNEDKLFVSICHDFEKYNIPHLFVPGNHDPGFSYNQKTPSIIESIKGSINMHNHCVEIAPHLWIAGFGGSVPVRYEDGSVQKEGYPYAKEDMKNEIIELFSLIPEGDNVILLTHCPPSYTSAASSHLPANNYHGLLYGSDSMFTQISSLLTRYNLFLLCHGHIHCLPGSSVIHGPYYYFCSVINSGNSRVGYCKLKLKKIKERWQLSSLEHCFSDIDY